MGHPRGRRAVGIAVLGTGVVGTTVGDALVARPFADAAAFGEVVLDCTAGTGSLQALRMAGPKALADAQVMVAPALAGTDHDRSVTTQCCALGWGHGGWAALWGFGPHKRCTLG